MEIWVLEKDERQGNGRGRREEQIGGGDLPCVLTIVCLSHVDFYLFLGFLIHIVLELLVG